MEPLAWILAEAGALMFTMGALVARVGGLVFLLPGLGERALPMRVRLIAALGLAVLLAPMVRPLVPETPQTPAGLLPVLLAEASVGLVLGFGFRMIVWVLQIAGTLASNSMSVAQMFGSGVTPEPEPTIASLLAMGGIVLALMAGLHVQAVAALAESYRLFPFGRFPAAGDLGEWSVARVSGVFAHGVTLALPFVAVGFAYNIALGALSRAMPQLLVALIGVPVLVALGIGTLWLVLPELFARWGEGMGSVLSDPLAGLGR